MLKNIVTNLLSDVFNMSVSNNMYTVPNSIDQTSGH